MPPDPRKVPKAHGRMPKNPTKVPRVKPRPVLSTPKARGGKSVLQPDSGGSGCAVTALALAGGVVSVVGGMAYGGIELVKVMF